ncbi:MAG: nuclear transport factor 2 family protein, partial [Gemmatimonadota bacterium]|nr:nuclear transport factor 2 family protein [Gemmatimonadota bacterium]
MTPNSLGRIAVKSLRLIAFLVVLQGVVPAGLSSQEPERGVRREVANYIRLLNRHKPEAVAALYARATPPTSMGDGQATEGRDAIEGLYRRFFDAAGTARGAADSVHVVPLGEASALAWFRFRWVSGGAGGGVISLVYLREGSRWAILHDHMSLTRAGT